MDIFQDNRSLLTLITSIDFNLKYLRKSYIVHNQVLKLGTSKSGSRRVSHLMELITCPVRRCGDEVPQGKPSTVPIPAWAYPATFVEEMLCTFTNVLIRQEEEEQVEQRGGGVRN